jgi:hypothetical protein
VAEFVVSPNRGHALTIDHGWREIGDRTIAFIDRFARPTEIEDASL